jgi:ABC-type polysaccharide/polyol phosphate transport system ATPase subunit
LHGEDFGGFRKREKASLMFSERRLLVVEKQPAKTSVSSADDIVIRAQKVSKCYQLYDNPQDRLKQAIYRRYHSLLGRPLKDYARSFWALTDVSFDLKKGETIGIIGRNGSGKSTLLQIVCGTLASTSGFIETRGRVAALLELGAGFNPDFTGRENVYMNATILGLTKQEIDARFDEIAAFADIGDFVEQPVKTYSSGMVARLAFSVAVQVDPDVLIVDEALSIGDMAFQEKSFTRMKQIRERGTSILFVSHSISAVRNFCDRAMWLDRGRIRSIGERLSVTDEYQKEMEAEIRRELVPLSDRMKLGLGDASRDHDNRTIIIVETSVDKHTYRMGEDIKIDVRLRYNKNPPLYGVGLIIENMDGNVVTILNTLRDDICLQEQVEHVTLTIRDNHFAPGQYHVTVSICDGHGMFSYDKWDSCMGFEVEMERSDRGFAKVDGMLRCDHDWLWQ